MTDLDLGRATIVYEDPEDGYTERTVDNEQLVYGRDHWALKAGTDDRGNDVIQEIPRHRVYRVERSVERFEEEVRTVRHRVESLARDISERLPIDVGAGSRDAKRRSHEEWNERTASEGTTVPVTGTEREEE
jgi:predicted DNA-binding transcriptional regulator YafY